MGLLSRKPRDVMHYARQMSNEWERQAFAAVYAATGDARSARDAAQGRRASSDANPGETARRWLEAHQPTVTPMLVR